MRRIYPIAAGQSVVFIEVGSSTTAAAVNASFSSTWFGAIPPPTFVIGNYSGGGIGFSQTADAVNIYNAAGTLQANVTMTSLHGRRLTTPPD